MKNLFLLFIFLYFNISFSTVENLKFDTEINKKNEIVITVRKNKNNIDILKKYNLTLEDFKKLNITLNEFENLTEDERINILNGVKNE